MILIEVTNKQGRLEFYNTEQVLVAMACLNCKDIQALDHFHKNKNAKGGVTPVCKKCRKDKQALVPKKRKRYYKLDSDGVLIERQCTDCLHIKPSSYFYKHAASVGGISCVCKECSRREGINYREAESGKVKKYQKQYYKSNSERIRTNVKKWRGANKDKTYNYDKRITREQKINFKFNKQIREIKKIKTDSKQVLDHIIPLKHRDVCGLNVPWNIQLLTWSDNCSKSNKFDGTYENESWKKDL